MKAHPEKFEQLREMRLSAWFAVIRCYGLNGFSYASYETIAKESGQLNIQMSPDRTHFEKWIGLYILGYKGEFHRNVTREAQETKKKWKEKKMAEKDSVVEVETKKNEPDIFKQTVETLQKVIDENLQKACNLTASVCEKQKEKDALLEKLKQVDNELESQTLQLSTAKEGLEYLLGAKETFEFKKIK